MTPARLSLLTLALAAISLQRVKAAESPCPCLDDVNTLQGTDSRFEFSHGNTLPLVGEPWGMTDWSPQTGEGSWFFQYSGKSLEGFRATRQPSPWMGDYGQLVVMPQTGFLDFSPQGRASPYNVAAGTWRPDYVKVQLDRYHITTELTATQRCAVLRLNFAAGNLGRLLVLPAGQSQVEVAGRTVRVTNRPTDFAAYYVIEFDRDVTPAGTMERNRFQAGSAARKGRDVAAAVNFKTTQRRTVEIKIGSSYIGYEQAERNLRREVGDSGFDAVRAKTAAVWQKHFQRLAVEGATDQQRKTFATCLYRALKFPHRIYELDEADKPIHRSPYDGKVHTGVLYADNGFWDTYRTVYAFYSVVYPAQWREIIEGWVQAYRENHWYPQWPSPGNRGCMIGTHIDVVLADAIVKGVPGLDLATAYEGMRKDAFVAPTSGNVGRQALDEYVKRGYVADGHCAYAMSSGLDYAYDDWCVAQVAKKLGKLDDYKVLMERAKNYRKSWDPRVGLMRARRDDGSWVEPFDEFDWGGSYVEGGPWQCSWAVQQDLAGLIDLVGGPDAMAAKLDKLLSMPSTYHTKGYGGAIHEMREMPPLKAGQYAHNNQPVHHILYMFISAGQPWKTEMWTRRACTEFYNAGPQGFAGDEDNGEMSAWYLLSALGFYPLTPGRAEYVLTSPLFPKATIHLENGHTFVVAALGNSAQNVYVQKRALDGREHTATWIAHDRMMQGGTLEVELGPEPKVRKIAGEDLPYSMSTHEGN